MPSSQFPDLMGKTALPALQRGRPAKIPKPSKGKPKGRRVAPGGLAAALKRPRYNDGDGSAAC